MTSSPQLVTILTSLISIALLLIVFRLWASLRLDSFRQSMFALRDEMFDYAADGNINFNDPAYSLLRKAMNGFIRYGHQLTFFRMSLMMVYWNLFKIPLGTKWWDSWTDALDHVTDYGVRNDLRSFHQRAMYLVADRLIFGSPFLIAMLAVVACQYGLRSLTAATEQSLANFIDPRILDEEAARAAA